LVTHRIPIVGGNWKMNTDRASAVALAGAVDDGARALPRDRVEVAVFPPFPYLLEVGAELRRRASRVELGAQDLYPEENGAFTGEVSMEMLLDCGVRVVLVGHSERRHIIKESEELINAKVRAALAPELGERMRCILCIGETLNQRQAGETDAVNERQLRSGLRGIAPEQMARLVVAYEPVWAIGAGKTATPADARDAHGGIRRVLAGLYGGTVAEATRIQYGGSVKASNAGELFAQPGIDGGLIGGASLNADEFNAIVQAAADAGLR
jgi:triosephosphate isomerase